jgi:hypothetical protein
VGQPEQFAKRTFAAETEWITGGAISWQDPPEIGLVKVQGDGLLQVHVRGREPLAPLALPWPEAGVHDEVLLEIKMPGDHLDVLAVERALLRRQARQVQRIEALSADEEPWFGQEPLWIVAPHVPAWLGRTRTLVELAAGCYRLEPSGFPLLWIAANELPLVDELVPFLVARSGRAFEVFARWAVERRPERWVLDMVEYIPMSTAVRDELLEQVAARKDDPEVEARARYILEYYLKARPEVRHEIELRPLVHQFERRLARALTPIERDTLVERLREQGAERVADVVLDLSREDLAAWLAAPKG